MLEQSEATRVNDEVTLQATLQAYRPACRRRGVIRSNSPNALSGNVFISKLRQKNLLLMEITSWFVNEYNNRVLSAAFQNNINQNCIAHALLYQQLHTIIRYCDSTAQVRKIMATRQNQLLNNISHIYKNLCKINE
jgi:hypothetical protein